MKHTVLWPLGLLILLTCPAAATETSPALDRLSLGAGIFSNQLNIDGRVDGEASFEGSDRDFDETLDFGSERRINLFELSVLAGDRHQFDLRHYSDQRQRSVSLDEDLRFNGEIFPVQASLRGSAGFDVDELTYTYWFRHTRNTPLGIQLGALRLKGRLGLSGQIVVEDVGEASGSTEVSEHLYAPLLGISLRQQGGAQWRSYAELRIIRLSIGDVHGNAWSGRIGVEYRPFAHWGIALQYGGSEVSARQRKADLAGELEVGFRGPQLLLRLNY